MNNQYEWIPFYEEFADKLLGFYDKRDELFAIIQELSEKERYMNYLHFEREDWWGPRKYHIDPFSVMATFNRGTTDTNRMALASTFAEIFHMVQPVPNKFAGIPVLDNRNSFFTDSEDGILWELFVEALKYSDDRTSSQDFERLFDKAGNGLGMITSGLYWIRPRTFMPLDANSRSYISGTFEIELNESSFGGSDYVRLLNDLKSATEHSFPEISYAAWIGRLKKEKSSSSKLEKYSSDYAGKPSSLDTIAKEVKVSENIMYYNHDQANYWWLSANPSIWQFSELKVGESVDYTKYNENGNRRRIARNYDAIKEGDLIIGYESSPGLQVVALGIVSYTSEEIVRITKKEQLLHPIPFHELKEYPETQNMEFFRSPNGSLFRLTTEEFNFLMDTIREVNPIQEVQLVEPYSKEKLLDEVFIKEEEHDTLVNLLERKKNLILQGPPGVGKTFLAKRLAYSYMGKEDDSRIGFVQFHQNYSYEDFVMGYKPEGDSFILKNGKFVSFCMRANNDPQNDYFFIIDEINRGNISKIFGELLVAIETDYRDQPIELAYNSKKFLVPRNVYIIGMMNTADRSLAMIDYALRRRFSFFEMSPGFDSLGFKKYQTKINSGNFNRVIDIVRKLNEDIRLDPSLGAGFQIGHSYFITNQYEDETLAEIVEYEIVPMLQEYWFDDRDKVSEWHARLIGALRND